MTIPPTHLDESAQKLYGERARYSEDRLGQLRLALEDCAEIKAYPDLTIFSAGSFARLEASEYSDLDLFFLHAGAISQIEGPRTKSMALFGKVIAAATETKFPAFSNDCEYLSVIHVDDVLKIMGGRTDDHTNYFTARMLMLLESRCLIGQATYDEILNKTIDSYFRDYPDHPTDFQPTFLVNDICRFWKTLLLNYEHKRNLPTADDAASQKKKTQQKVKNFKLKFSRMTTCFASVAALGSYDAPVTREAVFDLTRRTPRQRLELIGERRADLLSAVNRVLNEYAWFLDMTGLPTEALEKEFADAEHRAVMFQRANEYGDAMYQLISDIDQYSPERKLLRNLVI